jgi:hypothetical protein
MDISADMEELFVGFYVNGFEVTFKKWAVAMLFEIKKFRKGILKISEMFGNSPVPYLCDERVVVIGHETVGKNFCVSGFSEEFLSGHELQVCALTLED